MNNNIDIVIMWVDDSDKSWATKRDYWRNKYGLKINEDERYRDWDLLPFLFRGIEKYADWVNHIFLVTDDQTPPWLNINNENITVIDHKQIIPKQFLPTFNSHSIEINLHRIPGLSDKFVLFNDDMFITDYVKKTDFFIGHLPCDTGVFSVISPMKNMPLSQYIFNNVSVVNEEFSKMETLKSGLFKWINPKNGIQLTRTILLMPWANFTGFHEPHICVSYLKETFVEVWEKNEQMMINTTSSKFREYHNVNQWVFRYWQLASNKFKPRKMSFGNVVNLSDEKTVKTASKFIESNKYKILCVNDTESLYDFNKAKTAIKTSFEMILPDKSTFEL